MEWFFTLDDTPSFFEMAKVAVLTAKERTDLEPVCMFSGQRLDVVAWLTAQGVRVIRHEASLKEFAVNLYRERSAIASSNTVAAYFIRVDMPLYCPEDHFLYTDVDVMFVGDCKHAKNIKPRYLSCAPQENPWEYDWFNNGVMVLNGKAMKETYGDFIRFIKTNQTSKWLFEQDSYNHFFKDRWEHLPIEYNWKAYWGDERAQWFNGVAEKQMPIQIVHFHGPKPFYAGEAFRVYRTPGYYKFRSMWYEFYESHFGPFPDLSKLQA